MAHVIFGVYASPIKQKQIQNTIRQMEYDFQGAFKGKTRPTLSEIRLYDVRIKKELVPLFTRDLSLMLMEQIPNTKNKTEALIEKTHRDDTWRLLYRSLNFLRLFTPLKTSKMATGKPSVEYGLGWAYKFYIGTLEDPITPEDEEVL